MPVSFFFFLLIENLLISTLPHLFSYKALSVLFFIFFWLWLQCGISEVVIIILMSTMATIVTMGDDLH